jgi:hypothetical protein
MTEQYIQEIKAAILEALIEGYDGELSESPQVLEVLNKWMNIECEMDVEDMETILEDEIQKILEDL